MATDVKEKVAVAVTPARARANAYRSLLVTAGLDPAVHGEQERTPPERLITIRPINLHGGASAWIAGSSLATTTERMKAPLIAARFGEADHFGFRRRKEIARKAAKSRWG